jgi:hypothetical protein
VVQFLASVLQVVGSLLSELILGVKEANKKTRAVAYQLLVEVAGRMHEAEPPSTDMDPEAPGECAAVHRRSSERRYNPVQF